MSLSQTVKKTKLCTLREAMHYALSAADVYLDSKVQALRLAAKAKGANEVEMTQINHVWVLDLLAKQTGRLVCS